MMSSAAKRRPLPSPIAEESGTDHMTSGHMTLGHMTSSQPLSEKFVDKLSQLEQLQYQLTRQELQFAQKFPIKPTERDNNLSDTEDYRPPSILKKSGRGVRDSMDTDINVRASVNTEGGETFASAQSVPTARSQLLMSMSSMGGESLQEIWKMLDDGRPSPTPRLPSPGNLPQRDTQQANSGRYHGEKEVRDSGDFYLSGKQTGQPKGTGKPSKKLTNQMAGKVTKNSSHKPRNIRNYNVRDDSSIS